MRNTIEQQDRQYQQGDGGYPDEFDDATRAFVQQLVEKLHAATQETQDSPAQDTAVLEQEQVGS
jgi:hypothetical protein